MDVLGHKSMWIFKVGRDLLLNEDKLPLLIQSCWQGWAQLTCSTIEYIGSQVADKIYQII